jgi:protein phosphatase
VNEDNLLAMPEKGLFLVADGVGGRQGGEVASQTVVDVFSKVFSQQHPEDLRSVIEGAIDLCNQKIFEKAQFRSELDGMATTIALVAVEGTRAIIAHVGDSRVYRFDRKGLICLTEDHSEVHEAVRAGLITAEQAAQHPRRNVISRALGADAEVEPDFREIEIDSHTSFLLCTDGITRHITDDEIGRLFRSDQRPQTVCERMKELCYQGGAEDNLTAIVVDFGERQYADELTRPRIPAQAAVAQAAPSSPPPRPQNRIEVDLKASPKQRGGSPGDNLTQTLPAMKADAPRPHPPQSNAEKTAEAAKPSARKRSTGELLIKGEIPKLMKISLLIIAMIAGVFIGILFSGPLLGIANRLMGKGDPYETAKVTNRPRDAEINAAFARHLEGRSDEAVARLNRVLTVNPNDVEALFFLGRVELDQKKFDGAVNHLSQAAKIDPALPDVWAYLAMAYLGLGQPRNAWDALQHLTSPPVDSPAGPAVPVPVASPA